MASVTAPDYTKTRLYVTLDIFARVLSSVALAALGVAGWLLQSSSEKAREDLEVRDRIEREYLPDFRNLSDLELLLDDIAQNCPDARQPGADAWMGFAAGRLRYVALSTFHRDVTTFCVRDPDVSQYGNCHMLRLHSAVLMFSELLENQRNLRQFADQEAQVTPHWPEFFVIESPMLASKVLVSPESLEAWKAWISGPADVNRVAGISMPRFAEELRQVTAKQLRLLVLEHPSLGDRYVAIRGGALKEYAHLPPFRAAAIPQTK